MYSNGSDRVRSYLRGCPFRTCDTATRSSEFVPPPPHQLRKIHRTYNQTFFNKGSTEPRSVREQGPGEKNIEGQKSGNFGCGNQCHCCHLSMAPSCSTTCLPPPKKGQLGDSCLCLEIPPGAIASHLGCCPSALPMYSSFSHCRVVL
jgi:hypothetical protein